MFIENNSEEYSNPMDFEFVNKIIIQKKVKSLRQSKTYRKRISQAELQRGNNKRLYSKRDTAIYCF